MGVCKLCSCEGQLEHLKEAFYCGSCFCVFTVNEKGELLNSWPTQNTKFNRPIMLDKTRVKFLSSTEEVVKTSPKGKK